MQKFFETKGVLMTKKFLSTVAAAALISTSAMAYEVKELSSMSSTLSGNTITATTAFNAAGNIAMPNRKVSNSLLFPAFFSSTGWETTIRVVNTSTTNAIVAKVVFYDGTDSRELKDFNIYLSANDVWVGNIKIVDGVATVISTDDSAPIEATVARGAYPMATATDPMTATLSANSGYIEVIGMVAGEAQIAENGGNATKYATQDARYHQMHSLLREDYTKFSQAARGASASSIFKDGVVQGKDANFPYRTMTDNAATTFDSLGAATAHVAAAGAGAVLTPLAGDIRITNTTNGTDMVMPAINLDYTTNATAGGEALVYLEGEKANIVDVNIDTTAAAETYSVAAVDADLVKLTPKVAYITYGDAAINNNYALFTSPFKRTIAQLTTPVLAADTVNVTNGAANISKYFNDADLRDVTAPNYGSFSLTASIFDQSENTMAAGQFSPATTPTIILKNELDSTGTDITDTNKLPYYLDQASASGFSNGYVVLRNTDTTNNQIPAIVTQMMATTAGSTTVTNWIHPTTTK